MENRMLQTAWPMVKRSVPLLLGILIIAGLVVKVGISKLLSALSTIDVSILFLSVILISAAIIVKSLRWHLLLMPVGFRDIKLSMYSYFAGQVTNQILPTGSGEIVRISVLKNKTRVKVMEIIPGILIERLFDTSLLLLITLFFSAIYLNIIIILLFTFILLISVIMVIWPSLLDRTGQILDNATQAAGWHNNLLTIGLEKMSELAKSLGFYGQNKKIIILAVLLTLLPWAIFEVSSQYLLVNGAGYHITYLGMLGIIAVSWIIGTVSMLPGGLGTMEVTYALGLSAFGIPFETGLSLALIYRASIYLLFGLFSGIAFLINIISLQIHAHARVIKK